LDRIPRAALAGPRGGQPTQSLAAPIQTKLQKECCTNYQSLRLSPNEQQQPIGPSHLAVATAHAASGPFVDAGKPLLCGEGIENIDPMAFDDPQTGKRLLYWGSGAKPIKVQELAPDRLGFLPGSIPTEIIFPDGRKEYRSLIEGAWVTFRNGTYYLFFFRRPLLHARTALRDHGGALR
jgi:hypothetical protein